MFARLHLLTLIAVALILPFELKTPLVALGPIVITNVEALLYAAVSVWMVGVLRTRRLHWTPLHWGLTAWIAALILSAGLAPVERDMALKFTLRAIGGCALFAATVSGAAAGRVSARIHVLALALFAGAIASALAGLVEVYVPASASILSAFKTSPTQAGALLRASGTFQYANTAAMYWEAALPLGLAAGVVYYRATRQRRWLLGTGLGALIVLQAIILSASRAAWIGTSVLLIAFSAIGARLDRGAVWRQPAALALGGFIMLLGIQVVLTPALSLRLQSESDVALYQVTYDVPAISNTIDAATWLTVPLTVRNDSVRAWAHDGAEPIRLSYHWLTADERQLILYEGERTALPRTLQPGETIALTATIKMLDQPGDYLLRFDLVEEGVAWFGGKSRQTGDVRLTITGTATTSTAAPPPAPAGPPLPPRLPPAPGRLDLWRAALHLWRDHPLTGLGPDNYRLSYGPVLGHAVFDTRITSNNLYLETLANMGVVGVAALGALIASGAIVWRRAWRHAPQHRWLNLGVALGFAAFLIHGLFDTFGSFTPTYGLWWMLLGLLAASQFETGASAV